MTEGRASAKRIRLEGGSKPRKTSGRQPESREKYKAPYYPIGWREVPSVERAAPKIAAELHDNADRAQEQGSLDLALCVFGPLAQGNGNVSAVISRYLMIR